VAQHSSFNQKKSHNKTPNSLFTFHPLPKHFFNQKILYIFSSPSELWFSACLWFSRKCKKLQNCCQCTLHHASNILSITANARRSKHGPYGSWYQKNLPLQ